MTVRILQGDCRAVLREMPGNSVHMMVTSPPYWGLRDYGTEPLVWGGDEECLHSWGKERQITQSGGRGKSTLQMDGRREEVRQRGCEAAKERQEFSASQGQFCHLCGAWKGSLGLEPTPDLYVTHIVEAMREVWRVLRDDGTVWLNLGDSYATRPSKIGGTSWQNGYIGSGQDKMPNLDGKRNMPNLLRDCGLKEKDLVGMPWRVALALQADGWYLRSAIVWAKGVSFCPAYSGSCMPESVKDRPTNSYEMVFLLSKSARYYYDQEAVKENCSTNTHGKGPTPHSRPKSAEPGQGIRSNTSFETATWGPVSSRNLRSVWLINPSGSSRNHYAAFPEALVRPMILAGTSARGVCPECGGPWERVTTHRTSTPGQAPGYNRDSGARNDGDRAGHWVDAKTTTLGWQPSCPCLTYPQEASYGGPDDVGELEGVPYDPIPATVLDPFVGSGTTCHVAESLGRDSIGIDLSGDYVEMARRRIERTPVVETTHNGQAVTVEQAPMFEVVT